MSGRHVQPPAQRCIELVFAVDKTAAAAAQGIRRPDDERVADLLRRLLALQEGVGNAGRRHTQTNTDHVLAERFAVFRQFYSVEVYPDEAYVVFLPNPLFARFDGQVERRLPTHSGQYGIDLLLFQHLDDALHRKGQQIYLVCCDRIGHDRCRVIVDKGDSDTFFPQGAGSLRARIVKFTGLSNNNRPTANDKDGLDRQIFRHSIFSFAHCGPAEGRAVGLV